MLASVEPSNPDTCRFSPARSLRPRKWRFARRSLSVVRIQTARFEHGQFSSCTEKTAYRRFFDPAKASTGLLAANDPIDNTDPSGLKLIISGKTVQTGNPNITKYSKDAVATEIVDKMIFSTEEFRFQSWDQLDNNIRFREEVIDLMEVDTLVEVQGHIQVGVAEAAAGFQGF